MSLLAPNPHSTPATPALPPPPPSNVASVRTAVNLSVLKRHIPSVKGIIDSASHAVLYEFEPETREWTKKNVEGAMFIVERDVVPLFGFFILNRLGLDNAQAYLEPQLVLHQTDEYIMYRSDNQNGGTSPIYGLWIYDPTDRERIWQRLNQLKHLTLEISANLHRSPSSYPTNMGAIEDTTASTLHTPFTHHPSNPNGNPGGNKNTIDLLEMFRQASLNATPTTTTTAAASAASATTAANIASSPLSVPAALISSGSTSSPIDELLRTRSRLMPMGQSPLTATTTAGIDQSSQLSLPPPPAPIPTAFEHYAPEEQRGNTASLLALLMGGNGATPTTSGPPPPPPHYHHPTPSPHQIPTQLPQSLAPPVLNQDTNLSSSLALPPPSLSSSASNQVPSFEQPHPHPHQPPLPPPSSSSSSVYTGALPNHNPPNNPPRSDTSTTDHALARLFARFAPSQSQPLFVQTVLHAINHDPEFVELFYLLYRHARPALHGNHPISQHPNISPRHGPSSNFPS